VMIRAVRARVNQRAALARSVRDGREFELKTV
jgi:hypothetical protein